MPIINVGAVIVLLNSAMRVGRRGLSVVVAVAFGLGFNSDLALVRNNPARFSKRKGMAGLGIEGGHLLRV